MNIGIDIDGVLTDLEHYISTKGKEYAISNNLGFDNEMTENSVYGFLKKKDSHDFWDKNWFDYAINVEARPFCSEYINKLKKEGNNIIIITARTYDSQIVKYGAEKQKLMEQEIIKWLNDNGIYYDKIIFSNLDKVSSCLENKIDIMIEDSVPNIEKLKKHMKILCFDSKYNKLYDDKTVKRVYSWKDIYNLISSI